MEEGMGERQIFTFRDEEGRAVQDYEHNLQVYGLHPTCEGCKKDCYQYNAPKMTYFYCSDRVKK